MAKSLFFNVANNNDLAIDSNGDLKLSGGLLEVSQACEAKAETMRGELEYNVDGGLPYRELVFKAIPDTTLFLSFLKKNIEETEGVTGVSELKGLTKGGVLVYSARINTIHGETTING